MIRDFFRLLKSLMPRERYVFFSALTLFVFALGLSILNNFYNNTVVQPASGGEYTEGIVGQPIAINPILMGSNEPDQVLVKTLFSSLMTLADSYNTSSKGTVWSIKLKPDLKWSDGQPLTSDDVLFTVQTIQDPAAGSPQLAAWQGVTIERISEREVRFTLKAPYAFFVDNLKTLYVAPAHLFEQVPPANLHLATYNLEPIGSGPFKFVSYEKQKNGFISSYHLTANSEYPGKRALIDKLNFIFFSNYNDAFLSFNTKSIDGLGGFDPINVTDLKINHQTDAFALPRYYAVFFNPTVPSATNDSTVRTALDLATNKQRLITDVLSGHGQIALGPLSPFTPGYNADIYVHDHNSTDEAISLLSKNGWKKDAGGILTRTVGKTTQRLEINLFTPDIPFLVTTANHLKEDWAAIGAKVTVTSVALDQLRDSNIKGRTYQALLFGNVLRDNGDIYSFWHSSARFSPGLNLAVYKNSAVDGLLESIRKNFDEAKRNVDLKKLQQIIHDEHPAIFLYSPEYLYAAPRDLGGLDQKFLLSPSDRFADSNLWFLNTSRVFK